MSLAATEPTLIAGPRRWPLSVERYHRMIDAGIFTGDEKVELVEGELLAVSPTGNRHYGVLNWLNRLLVVALGDRAVVAIQGPLTIRPSSEPEPDVLVATVREGGHHSPKPTPADVLFLVEVADTSVYADRARKIPLYGRAGVAESWLVDLVHGHVEVSTGPAEVGYLSTVRHLRGTTFTPAAFPDLVVAVDDLLGPGEPEGAR